MRGVPQVWVRALLDLADRQFQRGDLTFEFEDFFRKRRQHRGRDLLRHDDARGRRRRGTGGLPRCDHGQRHCVRLTCGQPRKHSAGVLRPALLLLRDALLDQFHKVGVHPGILQILGHVRPSPLRQVAGK